MNITGWWNKWGGETEGETKPHQVGEQTAGIENQPQLPPYHLPK